MILKVWFVAAIATIALTTVCSGKVTPAEQCPGESFEGLQDRIQVKPCGKTRCKLAKNTNITVIFKFSAEEEVKTLTNEVLALVSGLPIPFFGVDGSDACGDVQRSDTGEKASCPLPAGHDYLYTNVFPVLPIYPTLSTRVHWSLRDGNKRLICFEVPAVITEGKH
ncbi:ecdysteroid-regulated 16 kDa protein [Helicoverpa armigera]|uniref:ecdysteroid-regulated 16 kDa protein n=1 Tax=Helicoverpa armigera TaxID=29058 RepID=UPI003082A5D4